MKNDSQGRMWYDSMQNAVQRTVIISEILDSRTRHLISVRAAAHFCLRDCKSFEVLLAKKGA